MLIKCQVDKLPRHPDCYLVKDDDPHDLALDDDDPALVVDADAAGVLQYIGAELANELAVLVVNLDLKIQNEKRYKTDQSYSQC